MSGTAPALTERAFRSMGTRIVVLAPADRPDSVELVRAVVQAWDARFTRFSPTSELAQLNAAAGRLHAIAFQQFGGDGCEPLALDRETRRG